MLIRHRIYYCIIIYFNYYYRLYSIVFTILFPKCIQTEGNCTEYPTSGIPNGGNTQRPEYLTEKLGILVVGYSGKNDRNTQQWNA